MTSSITSHDLPNQPMAIVHGHRMVLHDPARDRFIAPSLLHAGCFKPFETELVMNEVRPGDVVVDVGAHIGYFTLLLAALVGPKSRVFAFEPDPDNFALLCRNVELNGSDPVLLALTRHPQLEHHGEQPALLPTHRQELVSLPFPRR